MDAWSLGDGKEDSYVVYSHYNDGDKWRHNRDYPGRERGKSAWRLHARVPPGQLTFYIHEASGPNVRARTFELEGLCTWARNHHEMLLEAGEIHARLPMATEDRVYVIYLYRHERGHQYGDRYYVLNDGIVNLRNAIIPPADSGFLSTYFDGSPMSRMEFKQGLAMNWIWRWMQNIPLAAPPEERISSEEVERQFASSVNADLVMLNEEYYRVRLLEDETPMDIDIEEV